jgi:hypothetical protein
MKNFARAEWTTEHATGTRQQDSGPESQKNLGKGPCHIEKSSEEALQLKMLILGVVWKCLRQRLPESGA